MNRFKFIEPTPLVEPDDDHDADAFVFDDREADVFVFGDRDVDVFVFGDRDDNARRAVGDDGAWFVSRLIVILMISSIAKGAPTPKNFDPQVRPKASGPPNRHDYACKHPIRFLKKRKQTPPSRKSRLDILEMEKGNWSGLIQAPV
jgi:hypothetical protein